LGTKVRPACFDLLFECMVLSPFNLLNCVRHGM
jgi:hypothetical protein